MIKIKNQRGITTLALVLTIVVMLILAGITIKVGTGSIEESRMISFVSKMQLLQKKVDFLAENGDFETLGEDLDEGKLTQLKTLLSNEDIQMGRLPQGYQEVEYIEGTGTQYLDTNYFAKPNTRVIMSFSYTESNGEQYGSGILFRKC